MKLHSLTHFLIYPPRNFSIVLLIILSLFHFRYGFIPAWTKINSDFPNYYTSSKLLLEGRDLSNIYEDQWFQQKINDYGISEKGKFSPFPPPTAFVLIPEALLSPIAAKRVYLLLNVIVLFFTAYLLVKISSLRYIECMNLILLSGIALINNFLLGQFYLILILLVTLGYLSLLRNDEYKCGVFWGTGAAVKYFPLIFIPILILKKKWKTLTTFLIIILVINVVACLFFGAGIYYQFFTNIFFSHLNGELRGQSKYAVDFQSWNSLLRNIFVYDPIENKFPVINSLITFYLSRYLIYIIFLSITLFVVYKIKNGKDFIPQATILLTLLVFVLSPASASYHILLLILPVVLLINLTTVTDEYVYRMLFLIIYTAIGFAPLVLSKIDMKSAGLFLMYYRLWLVIIFFLTAMCYILKQNRNTV